MAMLTKYYFAVIVMALVVPNSVFGICKITDTDEKFEVVCSGKESSGDLASVATKTNARNGKKAKFDSQLSIAMNKEEKKIMETNNRLDGYRNRRKSGEH